GGDLNRFVADAFSPFTNFPEGIERGLVPCKLGQEKAGSFDGFHGFSGYLVNCFIDVNSLSVSPTLRPSVPSSLSPSVAHLSVPPSLSLSVPQSLSPSVSQALRLPSLRHNSSHTRKSVHFVWDLSLSTT